MGIVLALGLVAGAAGATTLRLRIAGSVDQADAHGLFSVGEEVELALDLDIALPLVQPTAFTSINYFYGIGSVDDYAFTASNGYLTSWNVDRGWGFQLQAWGPSFGDSFSGLVSIDGIEFAPGVFAGAGEADFLALDASDVRSLELRVRRMVWPTTTFVRAHVNVTSFVVAPEPGTAGLLLLAELVGLASRRQSSRCNARRPGQPHTRSKSASRDSELTRKPAFS